MSVIGKIDLPSNDYNNLVELKGLHSPEAKAYRAANPKMDFGNIDDIGNKDNPVGDNAAKVLENNASINNDVIPVLNDAIVKDPVADDANIKISDQVNKNQNNNTNFLTSFQEKLSSFTDMFKKDPKKSIVSDDYIPKSFDKDIGNAPEFSFGKEQTLGKASKKLGGKGLSESIPSTLTSPEATDVAGGSKSPFKASTATAALQAGSSAFSTYQKNKSLGEGIGSINDSIDTLKDTERIIAGEYSQDMIDIKSDLSETNQDAALQLMAQIKNNNEPATNLNTPSRVAADTKEKINARLDSFFSSQKSKTEDLADMMKTSADSSVAKITSSIDGLEKQKEEMQEAQKMNKFNTVIDIASAGANLALPGVGGMVAGTALGALKQENEYT